MISAVKNKETVPPGGIDAFFRRAYYSLFRLQLRIRCWVGDRLKRSQDESLPPALLRYRVSESVSVEEFSRIGRHCSNLVRDHLSRMEVDLAHGARILDFGCGCGRTLKWLARDHPGAELHGVDVDEEAIEWCRKNLPGNFAANSAQPPLRFPDHYFDAVYCFSVFTHLNEAMQIQWLSELHRILKPDGVLLVTVHGENAARTLDAAGVATLDSAGFVHKNSKKLEGLVPEWYQTTWHSRNYIVDLLSNSFYGVRYETISDGLQDIVTGRAGK